MISKSLPLALLPLLPQVSAWGTLGHDTVAFIAQSFISNSTAAFAQGILNDTSSAFLANVATWADSYRYTTEGAFSAPLHYIDALDSPPESCNVDYDRDCPEEGCIVSAIANYTTRLQTTNLSATERQKALKWVIHFLGDIHQPLHVENLEIGGNGINVTFDGTATNLHHIWDSNMAEKLIGGYSLEDARTWAGELVQEIETGKWKNQSAGWLTGLDVRNGVDSAMVWATDANSYVCTTVIPQGEAGVEGKELDGAYYDAAIPVIQLQIAKAGYRLAAWLDAIVEAEKGVEHGHGGGGQKRKEFELEDWMVEARRVRRAFGWNCGAEGHRH
ncbi:S1/P1 nuclease [Lophiostoma macrostomum CBS 122681]|uniref:S1/P1 nuclease n=1 Tax=Lophiostoma macrostomum CBS 122681 TaxID=1314788 RepID=A0A6A6TJD0_9PLEO|nr:S1/P1 nuclease [Lophiostoma macrostomum CBS 122681]